MSRFKAAFLDRDGTLNKEVEYLHRIEDFEWIGAAPDAVRRLNEAGLFVLVVTNQAGVARGYYSEEHVVALHDHMQQTLSDKGAHIDAFYYCPHHPDGTVPEYRRDSHRRKPATGMFEQGLAEWGLEPAECVVVGDKNLDMKPGQVLGMTTILVQTGYGESETSATEADHVTTDISTATDLILSM